MTATRMEIAVSEHVFSTTAPLVFALGDARSLQVHLISEFVSAPLLTALLINGEATRPYFHYAPNDLEGEGSLQLLPFYFRQCAVARDALRMLAEQLIAKFGKNKYTTAIYTPNPWGTFDQWETATELDDEDFLSESACSYYAAPKSAPLAPALRDTADSGERRPLAKRARQAT